MSELSERVYLMEYKQRKKEKEQAERQKEIAKIQRKKEQEAERKQYEKDILTAYKRELKGIFENEFDLQGLKAKYFFYKIENRNGIIKSITTSEKGCDFLETNYNKILNDVIKKYELQEQYNEEEAKEIATAEIEKMRPIWEEETKKEESHKNKITFLKLIWFIIKWIFIILFGGIFLIIKFVFDLAGI